MPFFQTSSGLQIYYETSGSRGPELIMLHGLGSSTEVWEPQIEEFSKHFQLFLLDFPGHGQSENVFCHSMELYADIVAEFMDQQGIDTAHFMGLSAGCAVALIYGIRHPERVASLVLQGPVGGIIPPWLPWAWPKYLLLVLYLLGLMVLTLLVGKRRTVKLMNLVSVQTKDYNPLLDRIEREASPLAKVCITLQSAYPPYIGNLHHIKAPVLVLSGKGDLFPHRYYRYVAEHVGGPSGFLEIPGGKHVVSLDNPGTYNAVCTEWLCALAADGTEPRISSISNSLT